VSSFPELSKVMLAHRVTPKTSFSSFDLRSVTELDVNAEILFEHRPIQEKHINV
jgi:hypothetical protein